MKLLTVQLSPFTCYFIHSANLKSLIPTVCCNILYSCHKHHHYFIKVRNGKYKKILCHIIQEYKGAWHIEYLDQYSFNVSRWSWPIFTIRIRKRYSSWNVKSQGAWMSSHLPA
jgi:hypothetical protein